ncbi:MAG: hypothetical protein HOV80_24605 [Polyangiaceae bacterium]|nr:hypothetical protein [Polyangiaceae bacterium]
MLGSREPTRLTTQTNAVVLVGAYGELVETVRQAALYASGARTIETQLDNLATVAAELRPYAIVVPRDLYDFGGSDLDALARDIDAGLVVVSDSVQLELLVTSLGDAASRLG